MRIISLLFTLVAISFISLSASLLGVGMWGLALAAVTIPVLLSLFNKRLERFARGIVAVTGAMSGFALALTLIAATSGGSFHISDEVWPLVICFGCFIALSIALRFAPRT